MFFKEDVQGKGIPLSKVLPFIDYVNARNDGFFLGWELPQVFAVIQSEAGRARQGEGSAAR